MDAKILLNLAKNRYKSLLLAGLLLASLSFLFLVVSQKNFRSKTDILIVQDQPGFADYYTLSKSSDYLSGILMESVYSEKFLDEMLSAGILSSKFLPDEKIERLKAWQKTLKIGKNSNVGIISIEVFANSQKQVAEISQAMLVILTEKNQLFLGKGQNVEVRVLSGPITEKNPTISQIVLASGSGFVAGIILIFLIFYYNALKISKNKNSSPEIKPQSDINNCDFIPDKFNDSPDFSSDSEYWNDRLIELKK